MPAIILIVLLIFQVIFCFVYMQRSKRFQTWDNSKRFQVIIFSLIMSALLVAAFISVINSPEGKKANFIALIAVLLFGPLEIIILLMSIFSKTSEAFLPLESTTGQPPPVSPPKFDWNSTGQTTSANFSQPIPPAYVGQISQAGSAPRTISGTIIQAEAFARMSVSTDYFGARVIVLDLTKLKVKKRAFPVSEGDAVEVAGYWNRETQQFKVKHLRNKTTGMIYRTVSYVILYIILILIALFVLARLA